MTQLRQTPIYQQHVALGARMVPFAGWQMPVQYEGGIIQEHLATRGRAGLFDISHMGRLTVSGPGAVAFLQHVLTNQAAGLEIDEAHYTLLANTNGGAVDDAYLYRRREDDFLLVVNAANKDAVWQHLKLILPQFKGCQVVDDTDRLAMLSLQGPMSKEILLALITDGELPEPLRNQCATVMLGDAEMYVSRTGYTGEPLCFELFVASSQAPDLWDKLVTAGAVPIGLGARDTLRLEAGLPLYGHELGRDPEGNEIPLFASPLSKFAVSFSLLKGEFIGRKALARQFEAFKRITNRDFSRIQDLPRRILPVAITGKGIARAGSRVFREDRMVGYITSGTKVPYWIIEGVGLAEHITDQHGLRTIALALMDSDVLEGDPLEIEIRNNRASAVVVPYHLRGEAPPWARAVHHDQLRTHRQTGCEQDLLVEQAGRLVQKALSNHQWRQAACINLIPSEQTPSPLVRGLSVLDPVGRYAEHKRVKALGEADIFYYQGTEFIAEVEHLLQCELRKFLGCKEVETRPISGQMANMAVFSAMVDFINRTDRKQEQRRMRAVLNHHIIKGGHLSAQPMGALRDFVVRDPQTEKPAVVNFPVLARNPYQIDTAACEEIIETHRPELIIFGKSMILHKEPVAQIRAMVDAVSPQTVILYDMAHVLGLSGPSFQEPFTEGAHLVTGSTHKTFFGTQRGVVAGNWEAGELGFDLWEAIERRTFPGSLSNHHLGTLVGLLMAALEMNYYKDDYQPAVIRNAKVLAQALKACGLDVAGDPDIGYTETHQVVVNVGYGQGAAMAQRLEDNHIIVNYQATPQEEGFTAAGALRLGVSEMTRFGMPPEGFETLAQLMADVVLRNMPIKSEVIKLRQPHQTLQYAFTRDQLPEALQKVLATFS